MTSLFELANRLAVPLRDHLRPQPQDRGPSPTRPRCPGLSGAAMEKWRPGRSAPRLLQPRGAASPRPARGQSPEVALGRVELVRRQQPAATLAPAGDDAAAQGFDEPRAADREPAGAQEP